MPLPKQTPTPKGRLSKLAPAERPPVPPRLRQFVKPSLRRFVDFHIRQYGGCSKCPLYASALHHVFYRGYIPAYMLFVGEAPGNSENVVGKPFVGVSGSVLDVIIESAENYYRELRSQPMTWCVTNMVCCKPPSDREGKPRAPNASEVHACTRRLDQFVQLVQPEIIVRVGKVAQSWLPQTYVNPFPPEQDWPDWAISEFDVELLRDMRLSLNEDFDPDGFPAWVSRNTPIVVDTYHPSWILRQEEEDIQTEVNRAILAVRAGINEQLAKADAEIPF